MRENELYLSFWQHDCNIYNFQKWCGNHDLEWKKWGREIIKSNNYKSVLDVGAGVYSEYYGFKNDNLDIAYTATEITDKFIDIGLKKEINVVKCGVQEMPFKDNSFDVVLCYDVINHQKNFRQPLRELVRVAHKEVIVSFFKPFLEEDAGKKELESCVNRFKIEAVPDVGYVLHRITNSENETTCIYNFFSKACIDRFLVENNMSYDWFKVFNNEGEFQKTMLRIKCQ